MSDNFEVFIKDAGIEGPNVAIMGGIHGNEKCGVNAIMKLKDNLKLIKGKITFIIANKPALEKNVRFVEENLNRAFTSKKDTLEANIANGIKPYLDKVDALLDLHASPASDDVPYAISENNGFDIVRKLGMKKVITNISEMSHGSTDEYMNLQGKVGICIECGLIGSDNCDIVADGCIKSFLAAYGMYEYNYIESNNISEYRAALMYKNNKNEFKLNDKLPDFSLVKANSIIGYEGNEEVKFDKDYYILFAQDKKDVGNECFILTEKIDYK